MSSKLQEAIERLQEAFRSTMRVIGPQLSEPVPGLTGPQFYILFQLEQKGKCTVGELADSMVVKPSAITAMIDRLDKHEYVIRDRDEEDRRVVHIRLTDAGRSILQQAKQKRQELLEHHFSCLTPEELESLVTAFEKLARGVTASAQKE
ncbi:MarR family winged helix-turn-helix transcriptional regulator [Brevibacillus sp. SIMBA_040]|uniref:MarR family winged helix-turn-helix transcriptional regulator n=1 Tax=unclassified Brevibacillus TaxID=2684853 RepID=UPI00397B4E52